MKTRIKNTPAQVRRKHAGNVTKLQDYKEMIDKGQALMKSTQSSLEKCNATLDKLNSDLDKFIEENAEDKIPQTKAAIESTREQIRKDIIDIESLKDSLGMLNHRLSCLKKSIHIPAAKFKKCFALKGINVPLM